MVDWYKPVGSTGCLFSVQNMIFIFSPSVVLIVIVMRECDGNEHKASKNRWGTWSGSLLRNKPRVAPGLGLALVMCSLQSGFARHPRKPHWKGSAEQRDPLPPEFDLRPLLRSSSDPLIVGFVR